MPTDDTSLSIERYVNDIDWPANRDEVINRLRANGAPEAIVERVQELPKHDFENEDDLRESFHGRGTKWSRGLSE